MASSSRAEAASNTMNMNMNMNRRSNSTSNNTNSKAAMAMEQYKADATLHHVFEQSGESGKSFDYTTSMKSTVESVPEPDMTAYLYLMQRGGLIQPFGCMFAVEEIGFTIMAYSENTAEMLDIAGQSGRQPVPDVEIEAAVRVGSDVRTLFTPWSARNLERAAMTEEISLLNPIAMESKSGKRFLAIVHRNEVGIGIDLEPLRRGEAAAMAAWGGSEGIGGGVVTSQRLAVRATSRLQAVPNGDIGLLCDAVVEEVRELTGYDRVMVYKFHEDEHGEVVAEIRRSDLEPYLGLHYPATDIPQASRFLFTKNRVRMIYDCHASPVKIIQAEELEQNICLVGSTLRAVHGCHAQYMANMGSIASLGMAVIVNTNENDGEGSSCGRNGTKLWGLVVCHHTSPRAIPFPLRSACEFLMQTFGLQINMEMQLAAQTTENSMLRTQTLLCDMLLRDAPIGIVTQRPSIMDLVKCDGAALYYGGKFWLLGITPTEAQIKDIADWLLEYHEDSTGLSTDSLADAGYPGAASLGDAVCGMAAARITPTDFLFWFRSHTAKEIKWGGAKHHTDDKDDDRKMHPRTSFKAFLEVVRRRSLPWENVEMDAIHSLQLIIRGSFDIDDSTNIVMVHDQMSDLKLQGDELKSVASEMVRLIETAHAPIIAVDCAGIINGWNEFAAELIGLPSEEAMGKSLVHDLVFEESMETVEEMLYNALRGEEDKNVEMKLRTFGPQMQREVILVVNACSSRDYKGNIVGATFTGQDVTIQKMFMDKFIRIQGDYKTIVQSPNPLIPPIFASDEYICCSEWNKAMEKLTGWTRDEVIGKMLVGEIFGGFCRLKGQDATTKFTIVLHGAIGGNDTEKFPFAFFDRQGKYVEALLTANKRADADGRVTGAFCFLQIASTDLQQALEIKRQHERKGFARSKELAYIRQELRGPLYGITFTRKLLEDTNLADDQKRYTGTSAVCERQIQRIMDDMDLDSIENGYMELERAEIVLGTVMDAVVSQVMIILREKALQLIREIPSEVKTMCLYGDQVRLQQILADFLLNAVRYTPSSEGWVAIKVLPTLKKLGSGIHVHLEFRITHPGPGLPAELIQDMFDRKRSTMEEGVGLSMCRKLLKLMNGDVQYMRESRTSHFLVNIELPLVHREDAVSVK